MDDIELDALAWEMACGQNHSAIGEITALDPLSLEERALRHVYRSVVVPLLSDPSALFKELEHVWFRAHSNQNSNFHGRALALAHNMSATDGLGIAITAIEQGGDVFAVIRMLADGLPLFERIEIPSLLRFCDVCYPRIKNDLANALPYNAAEQWLARHPEDLDEVIAGCLAAPSPGLAPLLRIALVRVVALRPGGGLHQLHALRLNETKEVSSPALEALGLVDWSSMERSEKDEAIEALREGLASKDDETLFSSALGALWLVSQSPDDHPLLDDVISLNRPFIVRLVGDHLGFRSDALRRQEWFQEKIMLLARKTGQHPGSYRGVDHVLASMLEDELAAELLQKWLAAWIQSRGADGDEEEAFPRIFPVLFQALRRDQKQLNRLTIQWLLDADLRVQRAARHILEELGQSNHAGLRVPTDTLDTMGEAEVVHLVRRLLGNVFRDDQLVGLVWSMTDTQSAEKRTFPLVHAVLADHVGYSYPHATRKHLAKVVADEGDSPLGRLATGTLQRMEYYYDALDALPSIEELRSPDDHRQRYRKASQRAMNLAYEEANKNSIMEMIATRIPLKGGRSSFSRCNGQIGEKMHLSSFSHSMAFPRAEAIDSIGCAIERFHFQLAKVGDT